MLNLIKKLALFVMACGWAVSSPAFTLLGPFDTWQSPAVGYGNPASIYWGSDVGGPQVLGNQYRWILPHLYYAYDQAFVSYFGAAGVNAIEQAIAVFNALPPVSQMSTNLTEFPFESRKINYSAAALGLTDLKSMAMTEIMTQLATSDPSRFTWCLRARFLPTGLSCPAYDYTLVMRNYDPVTWNPSAYVNNVLYTYSILDGCNPDVSTTEPKLVDPTAIGGSAVSDEVSSYAGGNPGVYFTGLTRDDAGALRYLLSKHQVYASALPTNAAVGVGTAVAVGAQQNSSPWNFVVAVSLTNATVLGNNGSPWTIISFNTSTNSTNSTLGTGTGTAATNTTFNLAGVEKITFIQVLYDSTVGVTYNSFVDPYSVTAYVNGKSTTIATARQVTTPDLLFGTGDLLTDGTAGLAPVFITRTVAPGNYALSPYIAAFSFENGPGAINPGGHAVNFSSIGPYVVTTAGSSLNGVTPGLIIDWGSFDGSTNAPVVYPAGLSVQALENQLFP